MVRAMGIIYASTMHVPTGLTLLFRCNYRFYSPGRCSQGYYQGYLHVSKDERQRMNSSTSASSGFYTQGFLTATRSSAWSKICLHSSAPNATIRPIFLASRAQGRLAKNIICTSWAMSPYTRGYVTMQTEENRRWLQSLAARMPVLLKASRRKLLEDLRRSQSRLEAYSQLQRLMPCCNMCFMPRACLVVSVRNMQYWLAPSSTYSTSPTDCCIL